MKCLTCFWWDGEEDEHGFCYGVPPTIRDGIYVYGEWPLTTADARCPRYRRDVGKTLASWYWAIRRWWYAHRSGT